MDKIFSARLSEQSIHLISKLSHNNNSSKKSIIEKAINDLWAKENDSEHNHLLFKAFGIWQNREDLEELSTANIKKKFDNSFKKNQK